MSVFLHWITFESGGGGGGGGKLWVSAPFTPSSVSPDEGFMKKIKWQRSGGVSFFDRHLEFFNCIGYHESRDDWIWHLKIVQRLKTFWIIF